MLDIGRLIFYFKFTSRFMLFPPFRFYFASLKCFKYLKVGFYFCIEMTKQTTDRVLPQKRRFKVKTARESIKCQLLSLRSLLFLFFTHYSFPFFLLPLEISHDFTHLHERGKVKYAESQEISA